MRVNNTAKYFNFKLLKMGSGGAQGFRCKMCGAPSGDLICVDCKSKL